jgi:hypothetical protein
VDGVISPEALLLEDKSTLADGGVLELKPFFAPDFACRLAESLAAVDNGRNVYARTPRGSANGVAEYAPHVSEDEWNSIPEDERFLRFSQIDEQVISDATAGAQAVAALGGGEFRSRLAAASGCALAESHFDVHVMRRGDFIGWHTDARGGRKLGLIVYLTQSWDESLGGVLESRRHGKLNRFVPEFNRALIFQADALGAHRVTRIESDAPRRTFGMWFL